MPVQMEHGTNTIHVKGPHGLCSCPPKVNYRLRLEAIAYLGMRGARSGRPWVNITFGKLGGDFTISLFTFFSYTHGEK